MARKGAIGRIAAFVRRAAGPNDALYGAMKAVGNAILSAADALRRLSPNDIAYRVSAERAGAEGAIPGYVVRAGRRGFSGVAFPGPDGEPVAVELRLDGVVVNRTYASQKALEPSVYAGRNIGFTLPMKSVWDKVRADQRLEVFASGRALRYRAGRGPGRPLPNYGPREVEGKGLAELVAEGCLINKFGRVQGRCDESAAWAGKAFGAYGRFNAIFEREFGKSLFAFYGVMLGFAREGGVLAHDMDLDLAYFSEETDPELVRLEFLRIAERLADLDVGMEPQTYKLTFAGSGISVTPTWIAGGVFSSSFGYVGDGFSVSRDDILPLARAEHAGYPIYLPRNPKAVAAYLYGKGWKYPDPGWKWLAEYKDRPSILAARLTEKDLRELAARARNGAE